VALNSTLYSSCFTVDNKVMITLTLFLVLQNIGLLESNYVQIALLGWHKLKNGLPSSDKTIFYR
jgi:hypothetical protein